MNLSLAELQNGNHKAFEAFFDVNYDQLCSYAFSMLKNMEEAEDIVQKSFFKLWAQRQTLNIKSSILAYLYRVIHNDCLNTIEQLSKKNTLSLESVYETQACQDDSINSDIEYSELQAAIDKSLSGLPSQCRKVFELSRVNQLSYSDIANELSISVNTVENHIAKALKILRVDLKEFLVILWLLFVSA
jgi:RNA polymerase sigma-70 factor (family 1)